MRLIEMDMLAAIQKWKRWKSSNTKFIPDADQSYGVVCLYDQVIAHIDPTEKKATWGMVRTWDTQTTRSRLRALGVLDQVLALKGAPYDPGKTFLSGLQMALDLLEPVIETKPITAADFETTYNPPLYHGFASSTTMGVDFSSTMSNDIISVIRGVITRDQILVDLEITPTRPF